MKNTTIRPKAIFTLSQSLLDELEQVSKELKQKKSHIVEKALTLYFDMLDIQIADHRMKAVNSGKSQLFSAEDVYKELEL